MKVCVTDRWSGAAIAAALAVLLPWSWPASAQDAVQVAPEVYKKIAESRRARVLEVTIKPGAKVATHAHPEHLIYFVADATLVMKREGRTPYEMNFTAWQADRKSVE